MPIAMDELAAYSEGRLDDGDARCFLRVYERDRGELSWVGARVTAFDQVGEDGARQIGLTHAFLAPGPWVKPGVERRIFAGIRWLVTWLEEVSSDLGLVFELRYNDRNLGWIRRGVTDDVISDRLSVWARDLERLERDPPSR